MNKKIILFIFTVLIFIGSSLAFTGESSSYSARASTGISPSEEDTLSYTNRLLFNFLSFNTSTSNFYSRFGILNLRPSIPIINSPLNNSYLKSTNPELNWSNSTDPEEFSHILYILELSDNINFQYFNYSNNSIRETNNVTQDISLTSIDQETTYYWRIISYDQYENSTNYSELYQFTIDLTAPTEFNLTNPANETNSTDSSPALSWQETNELNFLNYTIEFSNSSDFEIINYSFGNVDSVSNNSFSQWNSSQVLDGGTWYWRVTAHDKAGNYNQSGVFTYIVGVGQQIVQVENTVIQSGGAGSVRGPRQIEQVSLNIIQPSPISLFTNDSVITPIFITNTGSTTLSNINLAALTNVSNLEVRLSQENIGMLFAGQSVSVDMIIRSTPETLIAQHEITIEAKVQDPTFKDSAKFFINLLEFGFGDRKIVREKIEVINQLFNGNPDCTELKTLVDQAEIELEKENYNKALSLVEAAIQSCKDLVSSLGKELVVEPRKNDLYIAIIESIIALLFFTLIYRYYRKRKILKQLRKK